MAMSPRKKMAMGGDVGKKKPIKMAKGGMAKKPMPVQKPVKAPPCPRVG